MMLYFVGVHGACTGGREYGRICYKNKGVRKSWREAYDLCSADGGTLPVISNSTVQGHLETFMEYEGLTESWIGAKEQSMTPDTQWYWLEGNYNFYYIQLM